MILIKKLTRKIISFLIEIKSLFVETEEKENLKKENKLDQDKQRLLDLMRKDNLDTGCPFEPSSMWKELNAKFDKIMHFEGINRVESQQYNRNFSQSVPSSSRYYRYALWLFYSKIKEIDCFNYLDKIESPLPADSEFVYVFGKNKVSWDLLTALDKLYSIYQSYPAIFTGRIVVAELGAGWGKIGYVLKMINPNCTYVIFDLPETLLLSSSRLPQLLPLEKFFNYRDIRQISSISKSFLMQRGLCFCGTQDLARFENKSIDVFINTSSFQEMTKDQVKAYFQYIDKKVKGVLYLQQYWQHLELNKMYNVMKEYGEYPFLVSWEQAYLRNSTYSERYFDTLFYINKEND